MHTSIELHEIPVPARRSILYGDLSVPIGARGVVVFAHGDGSCRHCPRSQHIAQRLCEEGFGTLLLDLLTPEEDCSPQSCLDVLLLSDRLMQAVDWLRQLEDTAHLHVGLLGSGTGAAGALIAAADCPRQIFAVVSRGGRPDLAGADLMRVQSPTLLLVGGHDLDALAVNRRALEKLGTSHRELVVVPGASHHFEEPGALDQVVRHAARWFGRYLPPPEINGDTGILT